ncbi:MAG: microcin C ABC transporter permease YejB [Alphaproteobacteria bacterium]
MTGYILRRIALMVPTLFGILAIAFIIVQFAPGGPMETMVAKLRGDDVAGTSRIGGEAGGQLGDESLSRGSQGVPPQIIEELKERFGFDKPWYERFGIMVWNFVRFDFGESYFKHERVIDSIGDAAKVSLSLALWTKLLVYLIAIPLGIAKAVREGSRFDLASSGVIILGYAIPNFLFAVLLLVLFAGGSFWSIFPFKGIVSSGWAELPWYQQILDYLWHMVLPVLSLAVSGFATVTFLTKNSFLDEIRKQYVITARAKGLNERKVLYGHVFRNAMLIVIASFPASFLLLFFTGSILIEHIFSLDGMGLLGFNALINRDYPTVFALIYMFSLIGIVVHLLTDLLYTWIDPRIDFESREV